MFPQVVPILPPQALQPQFWLSFPSDMGPNKYFSGHNLKNTGRKQKVGYDKKYVIWMGNFYFILPNSWF